MDSVNDLRQMAEFDFNKPYGVSITFDDNDDYATFKNVLRERENKIDDSNNKKIPVDKCESESLKVDKSSEKRSNNKNVNKSVSLDKISKIHKKKTPLRKIRKSVGKETMNNEIIELNVNPNNAELQLNGPVSNLHSLNEINEILDIRESNEESIHNEINDHEPLTTFVEDLLNRLSDHLIIIIKAFYHYGLKKRTCDPLAAQDSHKRERVFVLIKSHFFELSYTTMETIILPQAQNDTFVNQFLDNTVLLANSKSLKWKCEKRLVKVFFDELLIWTKRKQVLMKPNLQNPSNDNMMLKQHLIRPPQPFNISHSKSALNTNYTPTLNTQNNVCIFSSGPPGNEISININPDTLINCNQRQYTNTVEWPRSQNDYASGFESAARNTPFVLPPYEKHFNDIQKNNINYYRHPPPPYSNNRNSINFITKPNRNNEKIVNPTQNNRNFGPLYPNHQNTRQQIQNHRTQVQYVNVNQSSPPSNDYLTSLLHDTTNITRGSVIEKRISPSTATTNPMACMNVTVRCCMCGKITGTTCVPYNQPCRPFYCSYLCQELDTQSYKATGGTSNT